MQVGVSEELAQSAPEYHADDDTTYDFQENEFKENKDNRKRKTLNLHEWTWSFCWRVEGGSKTQKINTKKDSKKTFRDELLEIKKQQLKLLEE